MSDTHGYTDEERLKGIRELLATDRNDYNAWTVEFLVSLIDRQADELTRLRAIEEAAREYRESMRYVGTFPADGYMKMYESAYSAAITLDTLLAQEPQP